MSKRVPKEGGYVELPTGLFTADGIWFHTSEESLEAFAGAVLERIGIESLLHQSGAWLRSSDTATAFFFLVMLFTVTPVQAALAAVIFYLLWFILLGQFVFPVIVRLVDRLSSAPVQGLAYVIALSRLGMSGEPYAVLAGLLGFVLIRWGILRGAVDSISNRFAGNTGALPRPDRILRSLIIRYAISFGVTLPSTEAYERRILEIWRGGKAN